MSSWTVLACVLRMKKGEDYYTVDAGVFCVDLDNDIGPRGVRGPGLGFVEVNCRDERTVVGPDFSEMATGNVGHIVNQVDRINASGGLPNSKFIGCP